VGVNKFSDEIGLSKEMASTLKGTANKSIESICSEVGF
jgi:hypothetical protein